MNGRKVALFTRAWIEIVIILYNNSCTMVALFTRAWIEIILPDEPYPDHFVALFTRAWIEILLKTVTKMTEKGRPLHEGVD